MIVCSAGPQWKARLPPPPALSDSIAVRSAASAQLSGVPSPTRWSGAVTGTGSTASVHAVPAGSGTSGGGPSKPPSSPEPDGEPQAAVVTSAARPIHVATLRNPHLPARASFSRRMQNTSRHGEPQRRQVVTFLDDRPARQPHG